MAESFFGSLKQERVQWRNYQTRNEAQQDVMNYITMWYNSHRLHSYLGYKSPNQFELEMQMPRLELQKASWLGCAKKLDQVIFPTCIDIDTLLTNFLYSNKN